MVLHEFIYINLDKFEHIALYAGFGLILYLTFSNSNNLNMQKYAILLAILVGAFYGATDELHQYFVPNRSSSIMDLFADVIGVALAQLIIILTRERKHIELVFKNILSPNFIKQKPI